MPPTINVEKMVDFLVGLLNTPSPTGDTDRAITYVQQMWSDFPFTLSVTPKGSLVGRWEGEQGDKPRALTAHVDTLGAMVREIMGNGRLRMTQLGSWVWNSVEGEGVTVFASNGQQYRGSVMPFSASVHAHTANERNATRDDNTLFVRLDARTSSVFETRALGIRVGDVIAMDPRVEINENGFIRSRHLDDKASVACLYGAIAALVEAGLHPKQHTTFHISNYEEVGHGGATGFPADLYELLAIDMAVVAANQQSDEFSVTICAKDSGGPYHMGFRRELEALAEQSQVRYQTDIYPFYSSDGEAYWGAGGNVRVGLIGPGVDASHHYERTHREALKNTAELIAAYLLS